MADEGEEESGPLVPLFRSVGLVIVITLVMVELVVVGNDGAVRCGAVCAVRAVHSLSLFRLPLINYILSSPPPPPPPFSSPNFQKEIFLLICLF